MLITPATTLLSPPRASEEGCCAYILGRPHGEYNQKDVESIVAAYFAQCAGIDPLLAIAQCIHETGCLTSALSQRRDRDGRPLRNPAGLGVDGSKSDRPLSGYVWDADRTCYRKCLGFTSWQLSVKAHIGRLLAYALREGAGTAEQQRLISGALTLRSLPLSYRGIAPTLEGLNQRWAIGNKYAAAIAATANAILGVK